MAIKSMKTKVKIKNIEKYLNEIEKVSLPRKNYLEIHKELIGGGPKHGCGGDTILIKKTSYLVSKEKPKDVKDVTGMIYCFKCNEYELFKG